MARNQITRLDTDIAPQDVADMVLQLDGLRKLPRPKNDDEVLERIDHYFQMCAENRVRPGIETLALALGVSRVTVFNWSQGIKCSDRRREIIEHAKMLVSAYIEQAQAAADITKWKLRDNAGDSDHNKQSSGNDADQSGSASVNDSPL